MLQPLLRFADALGENVCEAQNSPVSATDGKVATGPIIRLIRCGLVSTVCTDLTIELLLFSSAMIILKTSTHEKGQLNKSSVSIYPVEIQEPQIDQHGLQSSQNLQEHARLDFNSAAYKTPWRYKILALVCVTSLPVGHTWTGASLGPLKDTLRNEVGVTNTQFGVISASDAIVNSIWPIIGGIRLDWFGPNIIVLCEFTMPVQSTLVIDLMSGCTIVVLVGSVLAGLAVDLGLWRLLAGGHIFMGFGIAVLDSATQKFFYHLFGTGGLALAFGLESAVSRNVDLVVIRDDHVKCFGNWLLLGQNGRYSYP